MSLYFHFLRPSHVSLFIFFIFAFGSNIASARDQIRAVGSSTVYPFVTVAAEEFGLNSTYKTPIIESTGTGGGFKLFCSGIGTSYPDLANASRMIKPSERKQCADHGIQDITEIKIGYDGIVLANSNESPLYSFEKTHLFLALAKQIPVDGSLVDNPYTRWNEIDPSLPDTPIEIYGPPPTSGTRDAFVELVMERVGMSLPEFLTAYTDKNTRKKMTHLVREDGVYIEAGENDNLIVQKLLSNPNALGVFGFSSLDQNTHSLQGSLIDGHLPSYDNISEGIYTISRPLYVYVKDAHIGKIGGIAAFIHELTSEKAIGPEGYLSENGLIPLNSDQRAQMISRSEALAQKTP